MVSLNTQEHKENAIELFKKNKDVHNTYGPGGVPVQSPNSNFINHEYGDDIRLEFKSENSENEDEEGAQQNLYSGDNNYKTSGNGNKPRYPVNNSLLNGNSNSRVAGLM